MEKSQFTDKNLAIKSANPESNSNINLHIAFQNDLFWHGVDIIHKDFLETMIKTPNPQLKKDLLCRVIKKIKKLGEAGKAVLFIYKEVLNDPESINKPLKAVNGKLIGFTSQHEKNDLAFLPVCNNLKTQRNMIEDIKENYKDYYRENNQSRIRIDDSFITNIIRQKADIIILFPKTGLHEGIIAKYVLTNLKKYLIKNEKYVLAQQIRTPYFLIADFAKSHEYDSKKELFNENEFEYLVNKVVSQLSNYINTGREKIFYADDMISEGTTFNSVNYVVNEALDQILLKKKLSARLRPLDMNDMLFVLPSHRSIPFKRLTTNVNFHGEDIEIVKLERGKYIKDPVAWLVDKTKFDILKRAGSELGEILANDIIARNSIY